MSLVYRLSLNRYEIDKEISHITIDMERCRGCADKPCLTVCPAGVYTWTQERVKAQYEDCLECGTCQIACDHLGNRGLTWKNPAGGYGIEFRYG